MDLVLYFITKCEQGGRGKKSQNICGHTLIMVPKVSTDLHRVGVDADGDGSVLHEPVGERDLVLGQLLPAHHLGHDLRVECDNS